MTSPTSPVSAPGLLVVDDETIVRESLGGWFRDEGYHVDTAESGRAALRLLAERPYDIALVDIKMPGMDGLELQTRLAAAAPDTAVIMMTAYASVDTAVRALKAGAYDYIVKPFDPDELSHLVRRAAEHKLLRAENVRLKESLATTSLAVNIIGDSREMQAVRELIASVAATDTTVLVTGESGTGKELVAAAIHAASVRRFNPLVVVHCGALAEGVLESELFGHEKGSFTGASHRHKGKFEQAQGGTIFLDEVGDVSPKVQVELLRVIEEKRITRVGGKESIPVDFRVVAATNQGLAEMVRGGRFREDLYYRLNVVALALPPLRDRPEDVVQLATHFLGRLCRSMNRMPMHLSDEAIEALRRHTWPGNVRELQNAVERAVVLGTPPVVTASDLPRYVTTGTPLEPAPRSLNDLERAHIRVVLAETGWNMSRAARELGVDRGTLYAKVRKYGFKRPANAP